MIKNKNFLIKISLLWKKKSQLWKNKAGPDVHATKIENRESGIGSSAPGKFW